MLIYLSLIETEVININNIQVNILTKNSVTQVYWTNEKVYFLYLEKIKMRHIITLLDILYNT